MCSYSVHMRWAYILKQIGDLGGQISLYKTQPCVELVPLLLGMQEVYESKLAPLLNKYPPLPVTFLNRVRIP